MNQKIYRQEALDRLSSPDQFDQLMPLTSPRGWIALAGAGLVLVAATLWAIFGSITVTVNGEGLFTRPGGVHFVTAPAASRVESVAATVGQKVERNQALLRLASRKIDSPVAGRVLAVSVRKDDQVKAGSALVTIEPLDAPLEAVLFVPASEDAYLIKQGEPIRVTRGSGKGGKGLSVNGRIRTASRYPVDGETLLRVLQSETWVEQVTRSGPVLQVVVDLDPGEMEAEPRGPDDQELPPLYSGAPCHAHLVVQRKRPISLVLPIFGLIAE